MSNELEVGMKDAIGVLFERGHSRRKIASMLKINRNTVNRHIRQIRSKYATVSHGDSGVAPSSDRAVVSPGASKCEKYRDFILSCLEQGLTGQRIYQDLVCGHGFAGNYKSVVRFVRSLRNCAEIPFRRMESMPGQEMQVDFGSGAPILEHGKRRRTHLFRTVLSHSRAGYSECVFRQDTESFIRAMENAFRHYGGVPASVVTDNLKAAVARSDWFDPELNPKIVDFCHHYGTAILPAKPGVPRHKGKIERGIGYVQSNALKGRAFASLAEQNSFLAQWETNVADRRIHGTTREQVCTAFEKEKPFLKPLPPMLFPCFGEGTRIVHRDGYVEVKGAYYMVPWEYTGKELWVRWESHLVRIFNHRREQVVVYPRAEEGRFEGREEFMNPRKKSQIENGREWLLRKVSLIGPGALAWARAMLANRGDIGLRVMLGLCSLSRKHPASEIDSACAAALESGAFRLRELRSFIGRKDGQGQFEFMESHPLIRDLGFYGNITRQNERDGQ